MDHSAWTTDSSDAAWEVVAHRGAKRRARPRRSRGDARSRRTRGLVEHCAAFGCALDGGAAGVGTPAGLRRVRRRNARRTVLVLTSSTAARSLAGGNRAPGLPSSSAMASWMSAATCSYRSVGSALSTLTRSASPPLASNGSAGSSLRADCPRAPPTASSCARNYFRCPKSWSRCAVDDEGHGESDDAPRGRLEGRLEWSQQDRGGQRCGVAVVVA